MAWILLAASDSHQRALASATSSPRFLPKEAAYAYHTHLVRLEGDLDGGFTVSSQESEGRTVKLDAQGSGRPNSTRNAYCIRPHTVTGLMPCQMAPDLGLMRHSKLFSDVTILSQQQDECFLQESHSPTIFMEPMARKGSKPTKLKHLKLVQLL